MDNALVYLAYFGLSDLLKKEVVVYLPVVDESAGDSVRGRYRDSIQLYVALVRSKGNYGVLLQMSWEMSSTQSVHAFTDTRRVLPPTFAHDVRVAPLPELSGVQIFLASGVTMLRLVAASPTVPADTGYNGEAAATTSIIYYYHQQPAAKKPRVKQPSTSWNWTVDQQEEGVQGE